MYDPCPHNLCYFYIKRLYHVYSCEIYLTVEEQSLQRPKQNLGKVLAT